MPKITVMLDGVAQSELTLTKERTTIGRRPYNDVVIENLTVSGEHAVLLMEGNQVTVEDLRSTNGTFIGGRAVKQQLLQHGDIMEVGKYQIKFEAPVAEDEFEKTMLFKPKAAPATSPVPPVTPVKPAAPAAPAASAAPTAAAPGLRGAIKVLSGAAAGREMVLTKVVTTVGKPGVSVAAFTQRRHSFFVHHVEGKDRLTLNGVTVGEEPAALKDGDRIMLAGTEMQFHQS